MPRKPPPPNRTEDLRASRRGGKDRPRELRITTLYRDYDRVPWIRIAGHWLADLGLTSSSRAIIATEPGKLTLTLASRPRSS